MQTSGYFVQTPYFRPPCSVGKVSVKTFTLFSFLLSLDIEYYVFHHIWKQITALDYIS